VTIDQLKPERIIQGIIKIKNDDVESLKRDTMLPIVDILNKALRANDPHTLKVGLEALEKLNIDRIDSSIDSKDKLEIAKYYTDKISRSAEIALIENDEPAVIELTESLKIIGLKAIESRWNEVPKDETARFKSDGIYSTGIGIPNKTDNYESILDARGNLLIKSHEERVLQIFDDIFVITNDFSRLSKEEKIFSMQYFMKAIRNIVTELIQKDIYFEDWQYNNAINAILEKSLEIIEKDNCFKIDQIIGYIVDMGIEAVKKNHKLKDDVKEHFTKVATSKKCPNRPIFNIGNRGYGTAIDSKKLETIWICSCLNEIGVSCASKGLDEPTSYIFSFLEGIENNYRGKFWEKSGGTNTNIETDEALEVTENIITIIEELGNLSIEKRLEKSLREVFASLIKMGMRNDNTNLKKRICESLKHISRKLEDKEIFKSVTDVYEKKQGHELDKFKAFKVFCGFDEG
jgi:hypothetical protein